MHELRTNATPCGVATTNAVLFRVFRWNAERMTSFRIHVRLPFERYSSRRVYYQRSVILRFPLERTTDD
jgi:hypothetical protein